MLRITYLTLQFLARKSLVKIKRKRKKKILNFHVRINVLLGGKHFIQLYTLIHHKYLFHFETSVQYIAVYLHHNHLSEK